MAKPCDRSGYYLEVVKLAGELTAAALSTERGPLFAKLEEGRIVLFDWDGKQVTTIEGQNKS